MRAFPRTTSRTAFRWATGYAGSEQLAKWGSSRPSALPSWKRFRNGRGRLRGALVSSEGPGAQVAPEHPAPHRAPAPLLILRSHLAGAHGGSSQRRRFYRGHGMHGRGRRAMSAACNTVHGQRMSVDPIEDSSSSRMGPKGGWRGVLWDTRRGPFSVPGTGGSRMVDGRRTKAQPLIVSSPLILRDRIRAPRVLADRR